MSEQRGNERSCNDLGNGDDDTATLLRIADKFRDKRSGSRASSSATRQSVARSAVRPTVHEVRGSSTMIVHETQAVSVGKDGETKVVANSHEVLDLRRPSKRTKLSAPDEDVAGDDDESELSDDCEGISQSSSAQLAQFSEIHDDIQRILMEHEYDPAVNYMCSCNNGFRRQYRCSDCAYAMCMCKECILRGHRQEPFHWIEEWTGYSFKRVGLRELGLALHVGHNGEECPSLSEGRSPTNLYVVDVNGVHRCFVHYCRCEGAAINALQLVGAGIFPATVKRPRTGFTFRCLRDFHAHTLASKGSAHDYIKALDRKTNDPTHKQTFVPATAFVRIAHYWRFLTAEHESGQALGIDDIVKFRPLDSFAEICMACPIPDINTPDFSRSTSGSRIVSKVKKSTEDDKPHLDSIFLVVDGNMKLVCLEKNSDGPGTSLWDGRGYFRKHEDIMDFIEKFKHIRIVKTKCREFRAVENWNLKRFQKLFSTGVISVLCRHGIIRPCSVVNLQRGERFINTDFALRGALEGTERIKRKVLAYDVNCQYCANFLERWAQEFPGYLSEEILFLVGKMHVTSHIEKCQWVYNPNYRKHMGRLDGEEAERLWSEANQAAGSTKQMSPGHRSDTLDDHFNDWNRAKILKQATTIGKKLVKAYDKLSEVEDSLTDSTETLKLRHGDDTVEAWKDIQTEPTVDAGGKWSSAFRSNIPENSLMKAMKLVMEKTETAARGNKGSMALLIDGAILIQQKQYVHLRMLKTGSMVMTSSTRRRFLAKFQIGESSQAELASDIAIWRKHQYTIFPGLRASLDGLKSSRVPDKETLYIPSDFDAKERDSYDLGEAAKLELMLREGEASDAIRCLKMACRRLQHYVTDARERTRNPDVQTRKGHGYRDAKAEVDFWKSEYQTVRGKMIALGLSERHPTYQELKEADLFRHGMNRPANLGEGGLAPGWIWTSRLGSTTNSDAELDAWLKEDDRVQWLMHRATRDRWKEEVELLEEELRRLVVGYGKLGDAWGELRVKEFRQKQFARAAFAARKEGFYRGLADVAALEFKKMGLSWGRYQVQ